MRHMKYISFLLIFFITLSSILPACSAQPDERMKFLEIWLSEDLSIIEKMLLMRYCAGKNFLGTPFFVLRFTEPEPFTAEPRVIGIEFLNQTTITIGVQDPSTGNYKSLQHEDYRIDSLFLGYDYECSIELPDYIPEGVFVAHFDPQLLVVGEEGEVRTELTLISNIPKDMSLPENIQIRINISKYTTFGNLYLPAQGGFRRIPILGFIFGGSMPLLWLKAAAIGAHPFGRLYSGQRLLEYSAYVDIVLRLDRFHLANIIPQEGLEIGPDQLMTIPIEVQNLGSHVDCFNFRVSSDTDADLIVSPPPAITLGPNEVGYTSIGVASPRAFLDPGTAHSINIEAYSIYYFPIQLRSLQEEFMFLSLIKYFQQ